MQKVLIQKNNMQVWLCSMKKTTIDKKRLKKKEQGAEDRYSLEPEKIHPTVEIVIMEKFGGIAFCHLASRLVNVITQAGSQAGKQVD